MKTRHFKAGLAQRTAMALLLFAGLLAACASPTTPAPTPLPTPPTSTLTFTPLPTATNTVTPEPTLTPTITLKPTKTFVPTPEIKFVTLGPIFSPNCGDGKPQIWSNDSFNDLFIIPLISDTYGHVDIVPPKGCDVASMTGEFIAPISGKIEKYSIPDGTFGYHLWFDKNAYPEGLFDLFAKIGKGGFTPTSIISTRFDFGHVMLRVGRVNKGDSIGELLPLPYTTPFKVGYHIFVVTPEGEFAFSPTLFPNDGPPWVCYPGSPYDCQAKLSDYPLGYQK
jgi:hypothetical protein